MKHSGENKNIASLNKVLDNNQAKKLIKIVNSIQNEYTNSSDIIIDSEAEQDTIPNIFLNKLQEIITNKSQTNTKPNVIELSGGFQLYIPQSLTQPIKLDKNEIEDLINSISKFSNSENNSKNRVSPNTSL